MPILQVELVDQEIPMGIASRLADAAAAVLGSPPGTLWVRMRAVPRGHYGENGGELPEDLRPVFVSILSADLPDDAVRAEQAERLAKSIAETLGQDATHVHLLFEPSARGRIAFGGKLLG